MATHYGPHGKYFTEVVSKDPIPSVIQTTENRVYGILHLGADRRLIDELNEGPPFLAVTEARVVDGKGETKTGFMALNKSHIIWVVPVEEFQGEQDAVDHVNER